MPERGEQRAHLERQRSQPSRHRAYGGESDLEAVLDAVAQHDRRIRWPSPPSTWSRGVARTRRLRRERGRRPPARRGCRPRPRSGRLGSWTWRGGRRRGKTALTVHRVRNRRSADRRGVIRRGSCRRACSCRGAAAGQAFSASSRTASRRRKSAGTPREPAANDAGLSTSPSLTSSPCSGRGAHPDESQRQGGTPLIACTIVAIALVSPF